MFTISASRMRERARAAAAALLAVVAIASAQATERPGWPAGSDGTWAPIGSGTMRWLGFELYQASLWTEGGAPWAAVRPFALRIEYRRPISSERLVSASLQEMARLGYAEPAQLARWEGALQRAFPAVEAGDVIVGVAQPGRGAAFYHRGALTAEVRDERFVQAFFGIWLDERTREPALRTRLLGSSDEG